MIEGGYNGYTMKVSALDSYYWAHRPASSWPCSTLAGKRFVVHVDNNGLYDITVNGKYASDGIDGSELDAIVSDLLPPLYRHLWPVWEKGETK